MLDAPPKQCEGCQHEGVDKLITNGQFILKGNGWYHDGYGSTQVSGDKE
jgi:predicted nucleic acid-binding Zn ribbon protein